MTQLIVSLEDSSIIEEIKQAIRMLRGVTGVTEKECGGYLNPDTAKAFGELERGETVVCESLEEYKKLINDTIQD